MEDAKNNLGGVTGLPQSQQTSSSDDASKSFKEDPNRVRPLNLFDITEMSYEQYVEKHYATMLIKHREMLAIQQQWQLQQQRMQQQQLAGRSGLPQGQGMRR